MEEPNQLLEWDKKEIKPVLEVNFTTQRKEQDLQMMYLSRNLDWTPTYLIELIDEEKARLTNGDFVGGKLQQRRGRRGSGGSRRPSRCWCFPPTAPLATKPH